MRFPTLEFETTSLTFMAIQLTGYNMMQNLGVSIAIRNGKTVWKVVWIEYYLRPNLSSRRY